MSYHTATQAIIHRLRELPDLADAVIAEEFTSPETKRPVLTPVISLGAKSMEIDPVSHDRHTADLVLRLSALFPCGLTQARSSADIVYEISAALVGRKFEALSVERATVEKTAFDASMYGVAVEIDLHIRGVFNQPDQSVEEPEPMYKIGTTVFDRYPDKVTESRKESSDETMGSAPRIFTLEGTSAYDVGGGFWNGLHTLMHSSHGISFSIPRSAQTVTVKPKEIETWGNTCGRGFSYKLVFTEA